MESILKAESSKSVPPKKKRSIGNSNVWDRLKEQRLLFVLMLPAIIVTLIFSYVPMFGLYMAFINYSPGGGSFLDSFSQQSL